MIEVEFLGAAQTVTGSMHVVHTPDAKILLDCGLYQGTRQDSNHRNRNLPVARRKIDAMVLSHAHIDHSGALPLLYKTGYRGNIWTTPATRDLCASMLEDAAAIQQHDADWINRQIEKKHADMEPVEPLYDQEDVVGVLGCMFSLPYRRPQVIAKGVTVTLLDAGHVLGSALVQLDIDDVGETRRLLFTGDLGRRDMPILRDPESPTGVEMLIMESTYGDRLHDDIQTMDEELAKTIERTIKRHGKVIIPSFALERAQEVIYSLKRLKKAGRLPKVKVYVDSPLTVKLTSVFRLHPECYDKEARELLVGGDSPFEFDDLEYVSSVEDSKAIDASEEPCVIIAASGMCEFGRVVHHLKASIEDRRSTVIIVGFQAQHTLGRRLVEQRHHVRIFGVERERSCEVVVLNGFSAHGDQHDLLDFATQAREHGKVRHVALVHGEKKAQDVLAQKLTALGFPDVRSPAQGDIIRF